ncbi:MAG: polymer-forming cytoskeletal protein [Gammaproteobacteria bacterium]
MWGSSKHKRQAARIDTLVGRNTEVVGDIAFSGGLHVDGRVNGNVVATTDTNAIVSISEHGEVEGEVRVPHVVVNGKVLGDVYASDRLELAPNARVAGNVFYNLIEMAAGAEVNGKLVHQPGGPKLLELHRDEADRGSGTGTV